MASTPSTPPTPFFHLSKSLAAAAAAALTLTALLRIDANPSLYLYDKFLSTRHRQISSLAEQRIWIAGASSGIGAALAENLAGCGAKLVLTARSEGGLASVRGRCIERRRNYLEEQCAAHRRRGRGGGRSVSARAAATNAVVPASSILEDCESGVVALPLDVTAPDAVLASAVDTAISAHDGIDILILNAGRGQLVPSHSTPSSIDRELMDINYHSPVRLSQMVMSRDRWAERRRGHIVVTSSVAGKMAVPLCASYAAAKHAVMGYFNTLRAECAGWGLRVDLACPGPVDTDFGGSSLTGGGTAAEESISGRSAAKKDKKAPPASKMSPDRCASLIVSSMIGPRGLMSETWLSRQPTLGFTYLSQYLPGLSTWLLKRVGPVRIKAWEMGLPLYEASSWTVAAKELRKEEEERQRVSAAVNGEFGKNDD